MIVPSAGGARSTPRWLVGLGVASIVCVTTVTHRLIGALDGPSCGRPVADAAPGGGRKVRLVLMRHAQSENNARWYRKSLFGLQDPPITPKGVAQAAEAGAALRRMGISQGVDLVVASQLVRTMQTAALAFRNRSILVAPFLSEIDELEPLWGRHCSLAPGDCPRARPSQLLDLRRVAPAAPERVDWSPLDASAAAGLRGVTPPAPSWDRFVRWLWAQPAVLAQLGAREGAGGAPFTVAVVSHGTYLRTRVLPCGSAHPQNTQAYVGWIAAPSEAASGEPSAPSLLTPDDAPGAAVVSDVTSVYEPRAA